MEQIKDLLKKKEVFLSIEKTKDGVILHHQGKSKIMKGYSFDYRGFLHDLLDKPAWSKKELYAILYYLKTIPIGHEIYPIGEILFSQYENNGLHLYTDYNKLIHYLNRRKKSYSLGNIIPKESLLIYSDDFLWTLEWKNKKEQNQLMVYIGEFYRELDYLLGINTIDLCQLYVKTGIK